MGTADERHLAEQPPGGAAQTGIGWLESLLELSGALYVCAADPVNGGILGEFSRTGDDESDRYMSGAVLDWGRRATTLSRSGSPDVEDVMLTTDRSFHILRQVAAPVVGGRVLVYYRLDRGRANLAVARRALAAMSLHDGLRPAGRPSMESLPIITPVSPDRSKSPTVGGDAAPVRQRHLSVAQFPLPRRPPTRPVSERAGIPEVQTAATPPVLSLAWSTDVDVLRRLIDGLRRLV